MDLPTCPACGQSVLDDDVEDCPFCGASMTGKPFQTGKSSSPATANRNKPKRTVKSDQRTKPVESSAMAKSRDKASLNAEDDDPFAVDTAAAETAIQLRPNRAKGRSYEVVCPMCETAGYTSSKAAGREVRCASSECLVPLFTAPQIETKEEPVEEPGSRGPSAAVIAAGVLVIFVGGALWYFVFSGDESTPPGRQIASGPSLNHLRVAPPPDNGDEPAKKNVLEDDQRPPTPAEIREQALSAMIEASITRERNRSKPFCRRLTAEAFAVSGELEAARRQLQQLSQTRRPIPYYSVTPIVDVVWKELQEGKTDAALQTIKSAQEHAVKLPLRGRSRLDIVTALATILVAVGQDDEARELIEKHHENSQLGQLSADLFAVRSLGTHDLDSADGSGPLYPWKEPQIVAVTLGLAARGQWEAALRWAENQPDKETRIDSVVVWADQLARQAVVTQRPLDHAQISTAAQKLPPAGQARLYARLADRQLSAGMNQPAEQSLVSARDALASVSLPEEIVLPGMKQLLKFQLPNTALLKMAALAAGEIAGVEARLKRPRDAWASLEQAMKFLRAAAPSPLASRQHRDELNDLGKQAIRDRLTALLQLSSDDDARLALNSYRGKCNLMLQRSLKRFDIQTALLIRAVEWNLEDDVWNEIRTRADQPDVHLREPFYHTKVPWILRDRYLAAGAENTVAEIEDALSAAGLQRPNAEQHFIREASRYVEHGDVRKAAQALEQFNLSRVNRATRDRWRLRLACRLVNRGQLEDAFSFIREIDHEDVMLREDAWQLMAALATRNGHLLQLWDIAQESRLPPTEIVALYRGLVGAIAATDSERSTPPLEVVNEESTLNDSPRP